MESVEMPDRDRGLGESPVILLNQEKSYAFNSPAKTERR
jgi:hypothetical protein